METNALFNSIMYKISPQYSLQSLKNRAQEYYFQKKLGKVIRSTVGQTKQSSFMCIGYCILVLFYTNYQPHIHMVSKNLVLLEIIFINYF